MTDDFVECLNCGRVNPEWAQVCRSCGVPLRHGESIVTPAGRIPTDRDSLLAIAATIGTILIAVVAGLILSGLNPTDPSIGQGFTPSPSPTVEATPSEEPVVESATPVPTATPPPGPPGTLTFGTALDGNDQIVEPVDTFTPGMDFAHRVDMPSPWGVTTIGEGIYRINEDGTEEEVVRPIDNQPSVVPDLTYAAFVVPVTPLFEEWGPGTYEMRVFVNNELVAVGRFIFAAG